MSARRLDGEGLALLGAALLDGEVVGRYRDKIVAVPGSSCSWWRGAVSGRGHGRFWYAPAREAARLRGRHKGRPPRLSPDQVRQCGHNGRVGSRYLIWGAASESLCQHLPRTAVSRADGPRGAG